MKFGKTLLESEIPKWRGKYIDYRKLKKLISKISVWIELLLFISVFFMRLWWTADCLWQKDSQR